MIIEKGKEVVRIEAEAIRRLEDRINGSFEEAVELLFNCKGRVIVTGMGKSGIIGIKIASTLTSTGTAALFLHPAEGLHGDLGAVLKDDIVICISKSGNTEEILKILPMFKRQGVPIITITGNVDSILGRRGDVVLDVGVEEEACSYDLVPTSSTTATLVMGDALAMALFEKRGLGVDDFAQLHPGGDIGKRLLLRVDDVMRTGQDMAIVDFNTPLSQTIIEITSKRLGSTCVMDEQNKFIGIVTDGDLRRLLEGRRDIGKLTAADIMNSNPKTVVSGILAAKALHVMESFAINQLVVVNESGYPVGMVHIHDLLKAGLA